MSKIFENALNELDNIVLQEYGRNYTFSLLEADGDDDDVLSTPLSRMASFPARAIRFRKAKSVMNKYAKKIDSKTDQIIKKFEAEIDKSIPQITKRGQDLQAQLDAAKSSGDEVGAKSIINQQKKFTEDVKKNQEDRVNTLNQTIENLITTYTNAIHKRIDEPGYVLKVELSEKGKAELKFMWEELVSSIKQKSYEKLVKIINNKNIKGLESLVARLQVEIEEAEDKRYQSKRYRMDNKSKEENPQKELDKKLDDPKSEFEKLTAYLNDELSKEGDGITDEYIAALDEDGTLKFYEVTFHADFEEETLIANYFEEDGDEIAHRRKIENKDDADLVLDDIRAAKDISSSTEQEKEQEKMFRSLSSRLDTLLKNPTRDTLRKLKGLEFIISNYKKNPRLFTEKVIEAILKEEDLYKREIDQIKKGIPQDRLLDILKQLKDSLDYENDADSGKKLKKFEDLFSNIESQVKEQIKTRGLSEKNWKLIISDIILSGSYNIVPTIERFLTLDVSRKEKTDALKKMRNVVKLLAYSAKNSSEKDSVTKTIIAKMKKYLGDDSIEDILKESFISLSEYKKLNS